MSAKIASIWVESKLGRKGILLLLEAGELGGEFRFALFCEVVLGNAVFAAEVIPNFHAASFATFVLSLAARKAGLGNAALAKLDIPQGLFFALAI